jgi:hypothetical protein
MSLSTISRPSTHDRGTADALTAYASLPLAFVENRGQTDPRVRFYAHGPRYTFHLTRDGAMLSFLETQTADRGVALGLRFVGANPGVALDGEERAAGEVNYLTGADPARWQTRVPRFAQVVYRELWPGIDMALRGDAGTLKYEFRVRPGARIENIQLAYDGADRLRLDGSGALLIDSALGTIRDSRPVAFQTIDGTRGDIESRYVVNGNQYGFALGTSYDTGRELVIDPGIDYSTFLGGASHETAMPSRSTAPATHTSPGSRSPPTFRRRPARSTEAARPATSWMRSSPS